MSVVWADLQRLSQLCIALGNACFHLFLEWTTYALLTLQRGSTTYEEWQKHQHKHGESVQILDNQCEPTPAKSHVPLYGKP